MPRGTTLFFVTFTLLLTVVLTQWDGWCTDGAGEDGPCVPLRLCPPLLSAFRRGPSIATSFLRRSHCGFEGREPLVCCAGSNRASSPGSNRVQKGRQATNWTTMLPHQATTSTSEPATSPVNTMSQSLTAVLPTECGHELPYYIVGGINASLGEQPWLAGLEYITYRGRRVLCGGALITPRYVLTAAHCLRNTNTERLVTVVLGEHDMSSDPDCEMTRTGRVCADPVQKIPLERMIKHPSYSTDENRHNDIGLIRLAQPAKFSRTVQPVCLPSPKESRTLIEARHTITGWGRTETNWKSDIKQKVALPVISNERCAELYSGKGVTLAPTQMCAGGEAGRDSCSGDSGGPLVLPRQGAGDTTPTWAIVGVVSIGPQRCGTLNQPGIYTRVQPYLNWIMDNLLP